MARQGGGGVMDGVPRGRASTSQRIRQDFPILSQPQSRGKPLVFLDSGASAQKPRAVIDAMVALHGDAPTPTSIAAPTC